MPHRASVCCTSHNMLSLRASRAHKALGRVASGLLMTILLLASATVTQAVEPVAESQSTDDDKRAVPSSATDRPIVFAKDVQPILAKHCYSCHGPDVAESGLRFTDAEAAFAESDSGEHAIVPGDVEASMLITRVTTDDEWERMPPEGDRVSKKEAEILTRWIEQGAPWTGHWAFEPVRQVSPPKIADPALQSWGEHPIDAFIADSLAGAELQPNPPADRRTLIRRAYYDLTGLPPSVQQVESFVNDPDPLAYERLIDELLQSPHYGERWGRHWLDLVRYAETNSYERDAAKPNAWKYRDYVIESFNEDKPYDQFIREQLAGDELDEVTTETLTATGYYRLGVWDDEPADPLQARYDELDDLVATTSQVFLGLTIDCARCHDHKIDPIPQTDYYNMVAFFAGIKRYGDHTSQIDVTSEDVKRRYAENDAQRERLEGEMREIEQSGIVKMSAPDQRATEGSRKERQRVLRKHLRDHVSDQEWTRYTQLKTELAAVRKVAQQLPPRQRVLGLADCEAHPEPTHLLLRGNPHTPGDEVTIGFPELFGDAVPETPQPAPSAKTAGRRRILAEWIASPDNRMTARVMANRLWQYHFGRGIVESSNNFGKLGTPPTHPELLNWLANQLVAGNWKLKSMHRLIMTSRAYQMSSATREDGIARDPGNDLFWRFDPRRLSAEEVRDSILAVNETLNRKTYGPSFYPNLSAEVLAGQSQPGKGWGESSEQERARRSVYIHVKRSLLTPLLTAFDLPAPDRSCEARFTTLQPGQALSLLNSDFIHEQAAKLAQSIDAESLVSDELVRRTVETVLAREATSDEIEAGKALMTDLQENYSITRPRAVQLYCLTVLNWNEFMFLD